MNFNFDVLPAKPARKMNEMVNIVADLVNAAPRPVTLKEVMIVLEASGVEVPPESSVRRYLNQAVEASLIVKPTRQTYGAATDEDEDEDEADLLSGL